MVTIDRLIKKVLSYNPKADVEVIKRAYVFSREAHCAQTRSEGTPYIYHPLSVAEILADMKLDTATIVAGLLHDTVEDTDTAPEDIKSMFGSETAFLVDALTKLSKVESKTKEDVQAENFRKMLLAMSKDVRVILIKFADRLHNMRTLKYLPENKQKRIAEETLDIYAPLANRLGIGWMRTEFEDLSFNALMSDTYHELQRKVAKRKEEQQLYIGDIIRIIEGKLMAAGIEAKIKGRVKHFYGIHQKLQKQKIPFEEVHDVIGLRIITDTVGHCYDILGIIHSMWPLVPGRFKDFISLPKSNMYQSLHTTVVGPGGERIEFQIRTEEMDKIAEEGIAAHWRYKEDESVDKRNVRHIAWLRELVKEISDAKEFLEAVKGEVVQETVYVFTPNGDIKELPVNSTPIDFAYSIHTAVGHKCVGAKVNGRIVPLRTNLNSGDVVEIMTSPSHGPSKDWLKFVVTQRAKSRIKQWVKTEERKRSIELGTKLIEDELRRHGVSLSHLKSEKMEKVLMSFSINSLEDLYIAIGFGKVSAHQVVNRLVSEVTGKERPEEISVAKPVRPQKERKNIIVIKGIDNVLYHVAKCCFPVPGDSIIGFITKGKGITIHRMECSNMDRLKEDSERLVEVQWSQDGEVASNAKLFVESIDKPGILANLSALISSANVNISFLKASSTHDKRALFELTLEIKNRSQLANIVSKISQVEGVLSVKR
ncbi:MAG: bifunctional (p)ppGpp synthetase/guanosine-3',5'-bis(diphosphate) 3'-pyrophosphohydrolase [Thermodesulfovibrionales bacterium]|nr:bifunctional (p)ppGpp synthetase/guanosine-3',5'-bis(diphosphate) 3'-pyrophosphohydrolase [Thermodesulfovibrionales bacterium]